jgi:hypothetical protein
VETVPRCWHLVDIGCVSDVSEILAASIFKAKYYVIGLADTYSTTRAEFPVVGAQGQSKCGGLYQ